jgi:nucleotide-binding universal stress UspA family protein
MAESRPNDGAPRAILLATDLSARCDRALDRAAQLATQWKSRLVALHVIEPVIQSAAESPEQPAPSRRRPGDRLAVAERELRADLLTEFAAATAIVGEGDPAEVIARVALERGCGLIVTGVARDEALGRFSLGRTVDRLARRSRVSLLIVKNRNRRPYRHVVVATDFSPSSRHALEAALRLFPDQGLTLFHAFHAPFLGFAGDEERQIAEFHRLAAGNCAKFLAETKAAEGRGPLLASLIEHGPPAQLLREYAWDKGADLVVLGTHGRSAAMDLLLGSTAQAILGALPCDALLVRDPHAVVEG